MFNLDKDQRKATIFQNFVASTIGATVCVTASAPLDVIKTRLQKQSLESNPSSGFKIASDMARNEGVGKAERGSGSRHPKLAPPSSLHCM